MSKVIIKNSFLKGEVNIPPSKSVAHRAMICSFLAGGGTVKPIINSNDMKAMEQVIKAINEKNYIIDCIESGNTLRFMIPVICALGMKAKFIGQGRLPKRPIDEYLRLFPEHGVKCKYDGELPLYVEGKLTSGIYKIAGNISSQYITGLLLALPILDGDSEIVLTTELQSKPYVDMTIKVMSDYGVYVEETQTGYFIKGNQKYQKRDYIVEGDWSQAAFFLSAGAINGDIKLKGLDINSPQGDKEMIPILKKFGADIEITDNYIRVKKSDLIGTEVDATNVPDIVPSLSVVSAYSKGKTIIKGTQRLKFKESDRSASIEKNLTKLGINIVDEEDQIIIQGGKIQGGEIEGFNDHRIVMAFSVAGLCSNGDITISEAEAIDKTYPQFFEDFKNLGGEVNVINNRE